MKIILDVLLDLYASLPLPIFVVVVTLLFTLISLVFLFGLGMLLAMLPNPEVLSIDLEQLVVNWIKRLFRPRPRGKISHSYRTDPENRRLQADLLVLLKGDVATAKRLLLQQRRLNPGKSDNWYLEKVIYDLERDRR